MRLSVKLWLYGCIWDISQAHATPEPQGYKYPSMYQGENYTRAHGPEPCHSAKGPDLFCRCEMNHVGPCPFLHAFCAAKDVRSKEQIALKVVSDSSLKLAEQVGLRANMLCMSGGGLGHLATVLLDDPMLAEKTLPSL